METNAVPAVAVATKTGGSKFGAKVKICLGSSVSMPGMEALTTASFDLKWSGEGSDKSKLDLTDALVTTTGASKPDLCVRGNILKALVETP